MLTYMGNYITVQFAYVIEIHISAKLNLLTKAFITSNFSFQWQDNCINSYLQANIFSHQQCQVRNFTMLLLLTTNYCRADGTNKHYTDVTTRGRPRQQQDVTIQLLLSHLFPSSHSLKLQSGVMRKVRKARIFVWIQLPGPSFFLSAALQPCL